MHNIPYNSEREPLVIPEYGRNIQNLVRYAQTIEDKEKRQAFVEKIAYLIAIMFPQEKNQDSSERKIWNNIFRIANYNLDVEPPTGEKPTPEGDKKKPKPIPYPESAYKLRHYGHNVQRLVEKAITEEDEEKRSEFVLVIAAYMKLAYRSWNQESNVTDDIIKADLKRLSDGKLSLPRDVFIPDLIQMIKGNGNNGGNSSKKKKSGSQRKGSKQQRRRWR